MFDDVQEPKDMFADVPDGEESASQDLAKTTPPVTPEPRSTPSPQTPVYAEPPQPKSAALRLGVMVAISVVCIGGASYAAYRFMVRDAVPQQVSEVIEGATSGVEGNNEASGAGTAGEAGDGEPEEDTGTTAVVDSDGDGLSNDEERAAGTSVAKPDTDGDGLGDREEIKVYDTDPKKTDTDGDGYIDGDEVKNGYNPNGEGKLLQLPQ